MAETCKLQGGPQNGERVKSIGDPSTLPDTVHVGRRPMGDGYAAWGRELCARFPCEYRRNGAVFEFVKQHPFDTVHRYKGE